MNPSLPVSRLSRGFEDLKNHYKNCRVYINTTKDGYEDGYNLAMLEAMATGMPVVALANRTSPIINSVNGFVSSDTVYLRECVEKLLNDKKNAMEMGTRARDTVQELYGHEAFLRSWHRVVRETIVEFLDRTGASIPNGKQESATKKKILMDYVSYPPTTACYLNRSI